MVRLGNFNEDYFVKANLVHTEMCLIYNQALIAIMHNKDIVWPIDLLESTVAKIEKIKQLQESLDNEKT
ncbi:MAG: hypothetical protein IPM51_11715 [Sphingobacteriaceae bacterium]|nr:hypothetical protein [Sphingobacteriaceae bacterium]